MENDPVSGQIDNNVKSGIKIQPPGSQDTASVARWPCMASLHLLLFFLSKLSGHIHQAASCHLALEPKHGLMKCA